MFNRTKLDQLILGIEEKLSKMPEDSEDILLTKSILQFILALADKERDKLSESTLVATDDDIWGLTHDE